MRKGQDATGQIGHGMGRGRLHRGGDGRRRRCGLREPPGQPQVRHSGREAFAGAADRQSAVQPPSTLIVVPVIWSAAGEHRKTTVPPI